MTDAGRRAQSAGIAWFVSPRISPAYNVGSRVLRFLANELQVRDGGAKWALPT